MATKWTRALDLQLVNGVQEQEKRNVWQSAHSKLKWAQLHAHELRLAERL